MTAKPTLPPWAVTSLPIIWLNECDPVRLAQAFRSVSTMAHRAAPNADHVRYGQTLWSSRTTQGEVAVAWDWVELPHRVIALADPMQILSNVQIKQDDGRWMNERHRVLWLNDLVHAMPWQAELTVSGDASLAPEHRLAA